MAKRFLTIGMAALALVGLGLSARAKTGATSPKAFMKAVNTNADKTISRDELEVYAKKRFAALEADHDQTLDQKELKGRLGAAGIAAADVDKDKTVDEAEFVGYADKLFDAANTKGDKTLSLEELGSPAGRKLMTLLR